MLLNKNRAYDPMLKTSNDSEHWILNCLYAKLWTTIDKTSSRNPHCSMQKTTGGDVKYSTTNFSIEND